MQDILQSKAFKIIILCLVGLIILVFVFGLGVFIGAKKAEFSFRWADQYHRNFAGPRTGFFGDFRGNGFMNANGTFGQIIKINGSNLTVKDSRDNTEKIVSTTSKTMITFQRKTMKFSDLKIGDNIVVIGEPNEKGEISAALIRIMPPPPDESINAQI